MKKTAEGNNWFIETIDALEHTTLLSELKIKVIISESVMYYLTDAINFKKFIVLIDRVRERPEIIVLPELDKMITQLLSLSKYSTAPKTHREYIITVLNTVVDKIIKE